MKKLFTELFEDITKEATKIPADKYMSEGAYQIIDQSQNEIAGYTNCSEGLFTNVPVIIFGDHTRIIKYVDKPLFLGADGVKLLKAKIKNPNHKYLYYALKFARIPDTGYNRHFKWLKEVEINFPEESDQHKIVATLDQVNDLISLRNQQLEQLDLLVKSRFVEMFGDPAWNNKEWEVGTIRDIVSDVRYGTSIKSSENGKYPYLRMNNITYNGELDLTDIKYIDVPDEDLDKYSVKRGDVLFNRTNSKELVGKTCLYNRDELMILAGFVIRVRTNDRVVPIFLTQYMNLKYIKDLLFSMCKNACGQANINAQEFQNINIYIPPLALQNQFADFVTEVEKQKSTVKQSLEQLETLKKKLMQDYFG